MKLEDFLQYYYYNFRLKFTKTATGKKVNIKLPYQTHATCGSELLRYGRPRFSVDINLTGNATTANTNHQRAVDKF